MSAKPSHDAVRRIDALCDQFEAAWRSRERQAIETFLKRVDGPDREQLFRDLLALEIELRTKHGAPPAADEYLRRFPNHGVAIEDVFRASGLLSGNEPATDVTLTVVEGPHQGRVFTFTGHDTFLVGRSKRAHFQLIAKDMYFSRLHFLVEVNPPQVRVTDMKSRNGTWVNDRRVTSADLHDGDRIKAGHTILRVALRYAPGEQPSTAAAAIPPPAAPTASAEFAKPQGVTTDATAAPASFPVIPGYRLERELGRGGMGIVYRATESSGSVVALKTIIPAVTPTQPRVERFLREARILEKLRHPNIVAFRAMGEADGLLWFAMEFVPGLDAARLVKDQGPLPIKGAVHIACQLLQALEHAHERGFVHRDIKPANILLKKMSGGEVSGESGGDNSRMSVKLADFGLAHVYQTSQLSGLTLSGDIGGTVKFMAPEQITHYREVKPPADQYAAAATLYYLLTGNYVYDFRDAGIAAIAQILDEDPVPIRDRRADIPKDLAKVIHRALEREPGDRFTDAMALRKALLPLAK